MYGLASFEGHEIVATANVTWAENNRSDGTAVHGVGDFLSNMQLNVLSKLITKIIVIDVRKIVNDIAWAQTGSQRINGSDGIEK